MYVNVIYRFDRKLKFNPVKPKTLLLYLLQIYRLFTTCESGFRRMAQTQQWSTQWLWSGLEDVRLKGRTEQYGIVVI